MTTNKTQPAPLDDAGAMAVLLECANDIGGEYEQICERIEIATAHLAARLAELEEENTTLWHRLTGEREDREKIIRRYTEQLQHEVQHQRAHNEQLTKHLISGAAFLPPAPMVIAADAAALLARATRAEAELASVREDGARLDYIERSEAEVFRTMSSNEWAVGPDCETRTFAQTLRAAIDAARGGSGG